MKIKNYLLLSFLFLFSCDVNLNGDENTHHYNFNSTDYRYIPTIYNKIGKEIIFKNELNEKIKLEVLEYNITVVQGGGIRESEPLHTYEKLKIELKVADSDLGCDFKTILITKWGGKLITRIITRTSTDPCSGFEMTEKLEFPYEISSMQIENTLFDKVVTIFIDSQPYFSSIYSFDKVYFDFKNGIIGFDDTKNNLNYRLKD